MTAKNMADPATPSASEPPKATPGKEPAVHRAWVWPVVLSVILAGCMAVAVGAVFMRERDAAAGTHQSRLSALEEQAQHLQAEKQRLEGLLALPPCEAKALLAGAGGAAQTANTPAQSAARVAGGEVPPVTASGSSPVAPLATPSSVSESELSADSIEAGTVFLACRTASGISMGTGFFVAPGVVLTNSHVVDGAQRGVVVTNRAMGRSAVGNIIAQAYKNGRDYALVRVEMPAAVSIVPLRFNTSIKRTDKVSAWGYPHVVTKNDPKLQALLAEGKIDAAPELVYSEGVVSAVLERSPALVVHSASISPGSSGGPLVNAQGEVVGVNTLISLDEESYRQASIALPAADVLQFLQSFGIAAHVNTSPVQ